MDGDGNGDGAEHDVPIVETVAMHDLFATGLEVSYFEDFVRLSYWADHPLGFGSNSLAPVERQVVCKIVVPTASFVRMVQRFQADYAKRQQRGRRDRN